MILIQESSRQLHNGTVSLADNGLCFYKSYLRLAATVSKSLKTSIIDDVLLETVRVCIDGFQDNLNGYNE